jgi:hypothetical protein
MNRLIFLFSIITLAHVLPIQCAEDAEIIRFSSTIYDPWDNLSVKLTQASKK